MLGAAFALALLAFALAAKRAGSRYTYDRTPVRGEGEARRRNFVQLVKRAVPSGLRWALVAVHGANESGYGRSSFGNFIFGIKSTEWPGRVAIVVPVEITERGPEAVAAWRAETNAAIAAGRTPADAFRGYRSHAESVKDYVRFLRNNYPAAYAILAERGPVTGDDAERYARKLSPRYVRGLTRQQIIERDAENDAHADELAASFRGILPEVLRLA